MVASGGKHRWAGAVKQITKSNFSAALQQIKAHIHYADFIAVSSQKTGDLSASSHRYPWRRVLPIDIPETAYLKAKLAAETFELLQFAVCPFRFQGSKLVAFP
ncbi:putative Poly(A)-specific ribonuclease PARN-like [Cocos nucifera]|uniref:Putative Poly(A)-specific ribonuclease PARN-like n=1 Tax=Cocos nucifera TaxID=13894 RepID=A0A8K0I082_COCNU|nr:putative Poly(A)-specific ribonuclease PARN-like [Cocos nucifera]